MCDIMKKSKEGAFFIAFEIFYRQKGDTRGEISYIVDTESAIDSQGHPQGYKWDVINIFGPKPTYYGKRVNVLQVQRIQTDKDNDGRWLAEIEYIDYN